MKPFSGVATCALLALLAAVPAYAQQAGTATDPHHPRTLATDPAAPAPPSAPGSESPSMPMMDMCRQMMAGDMMATSMMTGPLPADPKERAHMLQMRGEMMKAMGDVMMKHAGRMQGPTPK